MPVQKQRAFANGAQSGQCGGFFVGVTSLIVPAVLVDALGSGYGAVAVPFFLKEQPGFQQQMVKKRIDAAVVVEIGVGGCAVNFIDDKVGEVHHNAYGIGQAGKGSFRIRRHGKAHITGSLFQQIGGETLLKIGIHQIILSIGRRYGLYH